MAFCSRARDGEGIELKLDAARLNGFPIGYRHLAYAQEAIGYRVSTLEEALNVVAAILK